ncbi:alpha/beta hydrolase family protein [Lentzea flaviverrucosa]|uniref:Chlorophyllase n=1 Tax=Lentzea flaviverrucosa TaxID=200379 RepID=A0A1H9XWU9_9PSEU|nr:alpha/beta fold hydrolase [Lentzea flaviverrucosa]RDI18216.1 chlorophyllase-like protein [Lentzea flaviverrucosa]SES50153.1 Chlorophyllase [Lentzea flaviverrucosa]
MTVFTVSPVVLEIPGRPVDLQLKVSAPTEGTGLPILLLSHGQGYSNHLSSLNGYAPLANHWAEQGFVVLQPTHLSSRSLTLPENTPGAPMFWRSRAEDMSQIIDRLDEIEKAVPQLQNRWDRTKIAVVGHSMGGHTASLLLGMRTEGVSLKDDRIKAGVLLGSTGRGDAVTDVVKENYSFMQTTDFSEMTPPALVVAGDADASAHLTTMGPDWHADPYHLAPGPKDLLTLFGAEHGFGGVSGYDVAETTDENPERVAAVQRLTTAYLRGQMHATTDWQDVKAAGITDGRIESK